MRSWISAGHPICSDSLLVNKFRFLCSRPAVRLDDPALFHKKAINSDQLSEPRYLILTIRRVLTVVRNFVTIWSCQHTCMQGGFDESTSARSDVYYARRRGDSGYCGAGVAVRAKTQEYDGRAAAKVRARVRASRAEAWVRTKSRSETGESPGSR